MAIAKKSTAKAKTSANVHSHGDLEKKIAALEAKVAQLEKNNKVLADAVSAVESIKSDIGNLKEQAKSSLQKMKEAMDSNGDGIVDSEEIYKYVLRRLRSRNPNPKK